jgi:flagellar hook-associated protein 1 FlgK
MAVGFSSYEIARSGLSVSERGLFTTGHNLSNVNTVGYTRQQAIMETSPYITEYGKNGKMFQYGLGADIQETRQIRHTFLDIVYRQESTIQGYWDTRSKTFQDVEAILNDPMGDGLQTVMNQFWDSWQELSKTPESLTTRALVRQRGQALVYYFNHIGEQLDKLQSDLNSEIQVRVDELNNITGQIAELNKRIMSQEINGDKANDFRDQRNLLLDRLSILCDAESLEMQDGQVDVTLGGYYLVTKGTSKNLYVSTDYKNGEFYYPKLEGTDIEINIKSGILKGLMESRGEVPGIKHTYANGAPKEKVDITLAIDTTNGSKTYLDKLKAQIATYVEDLKKSGVDYNIRLVSMDTATGVYGPAGGEVYDTNNIGTLSGDLASAFNQTTTTAGSDFNSLVTTLEGLNTSGDFRSDAARVTFVFTDRSISGDIATTPAQAADYINRLNAIGMRTSVITNSTFFTEGQTAAESGWNLITAGTGGDTLDLGVDAVAYGDLLKSINSETRQAVNANTGNIPQSNNIISDIKIRLNSMINAIAREVNYTQKTGYTLDGNAGADFFQAVDSQYPIEMGNLRLSDSLLSDDGLNNIVASGTNNAIGDNTIARIIANLRDTDVMTDVTGEVTVDEYYRALIQDVGNGGSTANLASVNQQKIVSAVDGQRTSISGVSMDEEMSNMMKYKFAYDASSRVLNIIDSMIETVVTSMGHVGR